MFEFLMAAFILFLASFTLTSGKPTISNSGIPLLISVWISTRFPSSPFKAIDFIFDYICLLSKYFLFFIDF